MNKPEKQEILKISAKLLNFKRNGGWSFLLPLQ
jgi:hypothetical protein